MSCTENNIVERARLFATMAHVGQVRKYTGEAYIEHPRRVAAIVSTLTRDKNVIAAAWLHDTVEDTEAELLDIERWFNLEVACLVGDLTDQYTPLRYPDMNRAKRKGYEAARLARCCFEVRLIKRADISDNTSDIVQHGGDFAAVYLTEKAKLLALFDGIDKVEPEEVRVASFSNPNQAYTVTIDGPKMSCTCPSYKFGNFDDGEFKCKHIRRVAA